MDPRVICSENHLYSVFHFLMCEIKKIKGFLYKLHLVLFSVLLFPTCERDNDCENLHPQ